MRLDPPLTVKGYNGTVTFDGEFVILTRKGFIARSTVGKGEKRMHIGQITAVQWKQPGALVNGFIEFTLPGGNEGRSQLGRQTRDAVKNENAVVVTRAQAAAFESLRKALEAAIAEQHQVVPMPPSGGADAGLAEQIRQLGELHRAGVLTDDEFTAAKIRLIGHQ
ncbi:DUF4429 domain-containing protein [Streptomyces sp. SID3343]|uniref:DUF4429 domain-containing protein n=1 Tax=Streptomyces sp. SID3343 TaxID=2690260 RepID=UPI00136DFD88|nr:DUF4429 domain-containing protein [Streptomyces sp. SID3343]MYV97262.1 DUF4429 domain-containing protein [Streptomyces sp. SID3343]